MLHFMEVFLREEENSLISKVSFTNKYILNHSCRCLFDDEKCTPLRAENV